MSRTIIVSNRLPIKISNLDKSFEFSSTSGGLATGMKSIHKKNNFLWIGWPGIDKKSLGNNLAKAEKLLHKKNYIPVFLRKKEINDFYYGTSNEALWPLFHYFLEFSIFNKSHWKSYVNVNKKFAKSVIKYANKGDIVWVHDYQLLLCPRMIKTKRPDLTVGFFLHIPFPSFEIFRIFPWREELLEGILGSDLIGFHTYDYVRHFLSSVKRILRYDVIFNKINVGSREVLVDTFPMGIDYAKYNDAARKKNEQKKSEMSNLRLQLMDHKKTSFDSKLILSIDRLDYTKGVINRIKAFEIFLTNNPEYRGKVRLIMLTVPSRSDVDDYIKLKKQTDEIVGRVNGKFASVNWTPIWYYYRSMSFDELIDLYTISDIAMITPVRDGMNLVAKEFVATRVDGDGVLILSEMAGASKELYESITVNPFDLNKMSDMILQAIKMPNKEQIERNRSMQERLSRYTVNYWANDFMKNLISRAKSNQYSVTNYFNLLEKNKLLEKLKLSNNKLIILDYDGTLVNFKDKPELALPDNNLINILNDLSNIKGMDIAIVSGRDKLFLEDNLGKLNINIIAEHGHFFKKKNKDWINLGNIDKVFLNDIHAILQSFSDRTPGTFTEKKESGLVWHFRKTDPELAIERVVEIETVLNSLLTDQFQILNLDKAIEVTSRKFDKGSAVNELTKNKKYDHIVCIGDDVTDENMFKSLNENSTTIKVGIKNTQARYYIEDPKGVVNLLNDINNYLK
ncbi:MAG: bifunctional alpha,alpha-trehalose-phosphate synthase (UDP-forming)/trehalose-phosphatase [Candidatus Marisimplicoccus sp.]